ncbi:MAG: hypothetical protein OIF32_08245 [Campylobacterales bacterium]|nr:hypothetical protein [Campylobacterales bacterium]
MITQYLNEANTALRELIDITNRDISDIKEAKHDLLFERTKIKEELVRTFENKKAIIDNEIVTLSQKFPDKALEELLDEQQQELLSSMKKNLEELKNTNKRFASLVISVSEFYDSLISKILPRKTVGYGKDTSRHSNFLQLAG